MLYKEDIHELGFLAKTPNRRIYHHLSSPYLMEIANEYAYNEYNFLQERFIIWEYETSTRTHQPILHRGPDSKILLNKINPTKEEVTQALNNYNGTSNI